MELAVVGDSDFLMGFELIGIKKTFEGDTNEALTRAFEESMKDPTVGIIVTNDVSLGKLTDSFRRQVENSVTPVTVVVSTSSAAQENLREMIKKAIGIDLWSR